MLRRKKVIAKIRGEAFLFLRRGYYCKKRISSGLMRKREQLFRSTVHSWENFKGKRISDWIRELSNNILFIFAIAKKQRGEKLPLLVLSFQCLFVSTLPLSLNILVESFFPVSINTSPDSLDVENSHFRRENIVFYFQAKIVFTEQKIG
jgi:hypothetical protein